MEYIRKVKIFKTYFKEFYIAQSDEVRRKIDYVIELIKTTERVPVTYLKQIENVSDYTKSECNMQETFTGYFVATIKGNW